jgi:uncharacterized protein
MLLTDATIATLKDIIEQEVHSKDHLVFIFGSWATGKARRWSDIDLGIIGDRLSPARYFALSELFENSPLPYLVDVVQLCDTSPEFIRLALADIIPLNFDRDSHEVQRTLQEFTSSKGEV